MLGRLGRTTLDVVMRDAGSPPEWLDGGAPADGTA
jgi:hypothetical protein